MIDLFINLFFLMNSNIFDLFFISCRSLLPELMQLFFIRVENLYLFEQNAPITSAGPSSSSHVSWSILHVVFSFWLFLLFILLSAQVPGLASRHDCHHLRYDQGPQQKYIVSFCAASEWVVSKAAKNICLSELQEKFSIMIETML